MSGFLKESSTRATKPAAGTFTNEAETWFNTCGGGDNIGDDGQQILDPKLPIQPGSKGSSNPAWMDEICADGKFEEGTLAGALWDRSMAGDAWNDAVASWNDYIPDDEERISFSQFVSSRFFGGPEGMHCEIYAEGNGCGEDSQLQCASDGITTPAGKYILNSFKRLDAVLWNLHDALEGMLGIIKAEMDNFTDTFAPLPDEGITLGTILGNLLGMGYGSLSSRMWEKGEVS
ncbi:hypothetical protein Aspvir_009173 [Aspergillus viridinutans]|uniref:Uncharacterized protein n=1 Tax=Aspergillus viridinutans TaxID=75553 RepID=A0A9P3BZJ0_ASPVI|nr:uncharacterized protein Aspvir_009173 [Aspergillus viridinutans]GIK05074.1 hypothetical protein Aspvir_009173 [Aspergillus viridinutans]